MTPRRAAQCLLVAAAGTVIAGSMVVAPSSVGAAPTTAPSAVAAPAPSAVVSAVPVGSPMANLPPTLNTSSAGGKLSTADLTAAANNAFEANDYAKAEPLLKDLSLRLRNSPDEVGPVLEKIRVCETSLAQQVVEGINGAPRTAHVKPADGATYEVTLKRLGNFDYDAEKGGNIPADVRALTGATIKLTGFMIPIDESDRISKFVLVPDLFGCCFGQPPQVQHTCVVTCPAGKAVTYFADEINVTGTLKVAERKDEGFITSIFEVTADSIRPSGK